MTNLGLSVSDVVNVEVVFSPLAAQTRNFGNLLVLGDSEVIDVSERLRLYTSITGIAADFGTSAPEYLAAALYYSQNPQPLNCYVGRFARVATHGALRGGILTSAQQAIGNFSSISNGAMSLTIDGVARNPSAMDFTAQTNLNGVATVLQTAVSSFATVTWDANNSRFVFKSATTGAASTMSFAIAPGSGVDVSVLLGLRSTQGGYTVDGIVPESLVAAVQVLAGMSNDWYGLQIASSVTPSNDDYAAVAQYIEAASVSRILGITTQDTSTLNPVTTSDLASIIKGLTLKRTFVQYSSSSPYASASIFGRAFTVDFNGSNTTITLKFKQEPSITPENLSETQAAALTAKNCNVFVQYNNSTAILQQGVMSNGYYFDEVHGTDWLQNDLQTEVYNLLYTSPTKIPQTDGGINQIVTRVSSRLEQAVVNGLVAPGVWNGPDVGAIVSGQTLSKGYYVFAPPVATQSLADRAARKAPVLQAAIKLAGAVHSANIIVNVNR